jgi:hypothetical protein
MFASFTIRPGGFVEGEFAVAVDPALVAPRSVSRRDPARPMPSLR